MPIDSFTVLLFGLFIKLVLGVLFLVFWLQKQRLLVRLVERVAAVGSLTSVLYMWQGPDSLLSVGVGNPVLIVSFVCCWLRARGESHDEPRHRFDGCLRL